MYSVRVNVLLYNTVCTGRAIYAALSEVCRIPLPFFYRNVGERGTYSWPHYKNFAPFKT